MTPNRIVALATALLGLITAVAAPLANFDWSSTAGVIIGVGTCAAAALKWLDGWQAHEAHQAYPQMPLPDSPDEEQGDDEHPAVFNVPQTDPGKIPPDEGDPGQPTAKPAPKKKPAKKAAKK